MVTSNTEAAAEKDLSAEKQEPEDKDDGQVIKKKSKNTAAAKAKPTPAVVETSDEKYNRELQEEYD